MNTQQPDYQLLFLRIMAMIQLKHEDRKEVIGKLHTELKSGIITVGGIAIEQIQMMFKEEKTPFPDNFEKISEPIIMSSVTDGYLMNHVISGIDPTEKKLTDNKETEQLGNKWIASYEKDQHASYIATIDPIISLMITTVYELRSNQLISEFPGLIDLPYKLTEKLNQYLRWSIVMGYVLGMMEYSMIDNQK
jgi:hypothetical protein